MNPRDSTPTTTSKSHASTASHIWSTVARHATGSRSTVVTSRNRIPGLGKSGTSRIRERIRARRSSGVSDCAGDRPLTEAGIGVTAVGSVTRPILPPWAHGRRTWGMLAPMDDDDLTPDDATEDELWEMLDEASGVDRARILHELGGRAFSDQEFEQSVALAESAAVQAREVGDELLTARSLFGQAAGLRRLGRTQELIEVAMEAADLLRANGEPEEIAECHGMVAGAFCDLGDDVASLEHWTSAARLFESEDSPNEAGRMWMSLGEALGRLEPPCRGPRDVRPRPRAVPHRRRAGRRPLGR